MQTRDVLVATNGYTDAAAPALQRRFVPIGSYIIATEPLSPAQAAIAAAARPHGVRLEELLCITSASRPIAGCCSADARSSPRRSGDDAARRGDSPPRHDRRLPGACGARESSYAWGGNVAFTRDQMPHAGKLDERCYFAGGYCGHGIAMATHLGEMIARRIAGEPIEHPLFDDRFAPIPFYDGRPWFLPLVGAYYKVKDWLQ